MCTAGCMRVALITVFSDSAAEMLSSLLLLRRIAEMFGEPFCYKITFLQLDVVDHAFRLT